MHLGYLKRNIKLYTKWWFLKKQKILAFQVVPIIKLNAFWWCFSSWTTLLKHASKQSLSYFDRHFCPFGSDQSSQDLFSYQRQSSQWWSQQMACTSQWTTHTSATAFKKILTKVKKQTKHSLKCFLPAKAKEQLSTKIVLCLTIRLILGTDHSCYCPGLNGKRLRKLQVYSSKHT